MPFPTCRWTRFNNDVLSPLSSRYLNLAPTNPKDGLMKALCWNGKNDIRCETVPDPKIEDQRDVIIRSPAVLSVVPISILWTA